MRRGVKLAAIGVALVVGLATVVPAQAANLGVLRGVVRDQLGAPLVGASVAVFDSASRNAKPIRSTSTNSDGTFATHVAPGRYLLRAVASGFSSFEARARVAANQETVLDSIALRRANTLADRRRAESSDPYRNVVRSSRGHVFHLDEADPAADEAGDRSDVAALALTERDTSSHGVVQTLAISGLAPSLAPSFVTNFAIERRIAGSDVIVAGQVGPSASAPQRFEARIARDLGDRHELELVAGYGRLGLAGGTDPIDGVIDQYSFQARDRWQLAGPIVIVYGLNVTMFGGAAHATAIVPRLGVELSPSQRTQVFARLTPASDLDQSVRFDLETGAVTFREPDVPNVAAGDLSQATPDRSRRFEFGIGHEIDERSSVEVMAFVDSASGRGIGFLAIPAAGDDAQFRTGSLDGRSSGVRVLYTRRISQALTGSVGYSAGSGLRVDSAGLENPLDLFRSTRYQLLAGRLEAEFGTGTRVAAVYRFSPHAVVFAIDPFAGRFGATEPSASFFVTQQLPMPDFLPGQWEAIVDVRNAFDSVPGSEDGEVLLVDYGRLVRAGLSFRF